MNSRTTSSGCSKSTATRTARCRAISPPCSERATTRSGAGFRSGWPSSSATVASSDGRRRLARGGGRERGDDRTAKNIDGKTEGRKARCRVGRASPFRPSALPSPYLRLDSAARSGPAEPLARSWRRCRSGKALPEVELVPRDEEEPVAARATQRLRRAVERRPMPAARAHAVMIAPALGQAHRLVGTAHDAPTARGSGGDELEQRWWYRHWLVIHFE